MRFFDENREYMEEHVKAGIEENRKGYAHISVKDAEGNPIKDVNIKAVQKNHEFRYGANLFMLDELETDEKNEKYKRYFSEAFNMATLPFYWDDIEPERGKQRYDKNSSKIYRRPAPDLCIEFCEKHGIEPREHALCYDFFYPKWLRGCDDYTVKKELSRRIREIAERYSDKIRTMEVTNELFWEPGSERTGFYNDDKYLEWCFKEAEKYMPDNQLVINEWSQLWYDNGRNRDLYYMIIERALANGAKIDAIGMQFHMFYKAEDEAKMVKPVYDPRHLYKIMDRYSDFNLPLQITEITIPAYSNDPEDEEIQADIIEALYSIWFSHKNVEQIIYWNLVDGYAAFAPQGDMTSGENYYYGGLVRFDLTLKPAYYRIKELFDKKWRTETTCCTDSDGKARFKGFYGEYEIEAEAGGKIYKRAINLSKKQKSDFDIVL